MLATQAANDVAVVIGSKKLGKFDHIVIDEAHALPGQVRNQGSKEVSGRRVIGLVRALGTLLDTTDKTVAVLVSDGEAIAEQVELELSAILARRTGRETVVKLTEGDDPVRGTGGMLEQWLDRAGVMLGSATRSARGDVELKVRRVKGRIESVKADLKAVSDHRVGVARWVEADTRSQANRQWAVAQSSPVEIGGMLVGNLWTAPVPADEEAPEASEDLAVERITGTWGEDRYELSVVAVSATLPGGFSRDMGMRAQPGSYPSPFEAAYGASAFFVPRAVSDDDIAALSGPYSTRGKPKFDTKAHVNWCKPILEDLVEANGGSALVLAATAQAGREYAVTLRAAARGRWEVLSQWDGNALRHTTAAWREDHHAVLVGTRSLMTGVDAPGDTCSLVVIDRIPRAASNPVDDARVEAIMKRLDTDKWTADRLVYSADAGLLLEQSFGRLIRSMTDSGMVACLDPRLLKVGPFRYQEATRQVYMKAAGRFERKISELADAVDFLIQRRAKKAAA
jgi:ATP-dependent DNA helicase DinG